MSASLTLYSLKKTFIGRNVVIEYINDFLSNSKYVNVSETLSIYNFQYQKIQKHMFIKVSLDQNKSEPIINSYNYVKIDDNSIYYFFIINTRWISSHTVEFELQMDYLNTFGWDEYEDGGVHLTGNYYLDDHTKVLRMHQNRGHWNTNTVFKYFYRINVNASINSFVWDAEFADTVTFMIDFSILQRMGNEPIAICCPASNITVTRINGSYYKLNEWTGEQIIFSQNGIRLANGRVPQIVPPSGVKNFTAKELIPSSANGFNKIFITISNSFDVYKKDNASGNWETAQVSEYTKLSQYFKFYELSDRQGVFFKKIDNIDEGINPILFKDEDDEMLLEEDGMNSWYVIYKNNNSVVSEADATNATYVNPVLINIVADTEVKNNIDVIEDLIIYPSNIKDKQNAAELVLLYVDDFAQDGYVIIGNTTYDTSHFKWIWLVKNYATSNTFDVYVYDSLSDGAIPHGEATVKNVPFVEVHGLSKYIVYSSVNIFGNYVLRPFYEVNIGNSVSNILAAWSDIDLSNPKLIKAINIPYAPIDGLTYLTNADFNGLPVDGDTHGLAISNPQKVLFDREILFENNFLWTDHIVYLPTNYNFYEKKFSPYLGYYYNDCESKMMHTEFYSKKFVYDSYTFDFTYNYGEINADLIPDGDVSMFRVRYVVSKNMLSKFMFQFPQFKEYKEIFTTDYPHTLIVDRNNEKALYTNAFINYIKSGGFSYDTGKNNRTNAMNGLMTALTLGGAVASFVSSYWTGGIGIASGIGLATTGIGAIARDIHVASENDKALSQKINQLTLQSVNVNSQEDIDMFTAIQGNKAKLVSYKPSPMMTKNLLQLFHKYGYGYNQEKHISSDDLNSRLYFNYVQADIQIAYSSIPSEYLEEIIRLWSDGVTFVHKVHHDNTYTWDVFQQFENWEKSFVN